MVFPNGLAKIGDVQDEIVGNRAIKRIGSVDLGTLTWTERGNDASHMRMFCGELDSFPNKSVDPTYFLACGYAVMDMDGEVYHHSSV